MTRQKKEILKKIYWIQGMVDADMQLGCGFAPAGAYAEAEHEVYHLYEELAHLRHYNSFEEMMFDPRGLIDQGIPYSA